MFNLTKEEIKLFKSMDTPKKIQDFINSIPINFEEKGDTCYSPRLVLKNNKCHCMEGAILAALILRVNGHQPLLVDLSASKNDFDHMLAVFKKDGKWGAISKTNHSVLRYREPVYNSIRELAMSHFHEYVNDDGKKTLRKFSMPVNLKKFDKINWMTTEKEVWEIANYMAETKHYNILNKKQIMSLRKADKIELDVGKIVEWQSDKMKKNL
ncbi:MAG: hypothetical protein AABW91_00295 [Nanoarchaeota archaeon]